MAEQRIWLSIKSADKLREAIVTYLSDWSEFNSALDVSLGLRKEKFSAHVFEFFATTSVPTMDGLADEVYDGLAILEALIGLRFIKEVSAKLLDKYHGYIAAEGLKPDDISRESLLAFKPSMDDVLSEWSELPRISEMCGTLIRDALTAEIFLFFSRTAEPNVDGLAEEMRRVLCDYDVVDIGNYKNVCQQLLDIHQSCLEEDLGKVVT